jgi:hypothetical protein
MRWTAIMVVWLAVGGATTALFFRFDDLSAILCPLAVLVGGGVLATGALTKGGDA